MDRRINLDLRYSGARLLKDVKTIMAFSMYVTLSAEIFSV